jgi:hypothetical protein
MLVNVAEARSVQCLDEQPPSGDELMAIRRLERNEWVGFCIHASHMFPGKRVEIDIVSPEYGFQLEARQLPLFGMSYDPKDDILELVAGDLDHLIYSPREMYVDEDSADAVSMQIIDADNVRQIVILRDPLMLPPPYA